MSLYDLRTSWPRDAVSAARCRAFFRDSRGEADEQQRANQIAALPVVTWKGRTLHTLRCHGETGKGPHDVNVAEWMCWALIDLRAFRCVYH